MNLNHYRSFLGQSLIEESPFEGTILENITMGDKSISQRDLYWALENMGLLQFIKDQPQGLNTLLFPEGKQIPYTIAKKIILARSIVKKPKVLILKDPLHQLDEDEALRIMNFLLDNNNPWALVVVSQDPKWIKRCNRIVTLDQGKIVSQT
jgi:ABC-type transport system involved in cytochrome bd biosynthesis fused ATPase/permease subunit